MSRSHPARRHRRAVLGLAAPLAVLAATTTACSSTDAPAAGNAKGETAAAATGRQNTATPSAPAGPPGVLFDGFRYTGPEDPNLTAHGWEVRTDGGGPGVKDTWTKSGVSFPSGGDAQGGQAMQLQLTTDGTSKNTKQVEMGRSEGEFLNGTVAARVWFSDKPATGHNGDHINECFYTISPSHTSTKYSELDYEYMPNGGWGSAGPRLDTTSWRSSTPGDRDTTGTKKSLTGWHTLMITADNKAVTYSVDGKAVFTSDSRSYPREKLSIRFSSWLIDLPTTVTGPRTWDMKVNWVYYQADKNVPQAEVEKAVAGFYSAGTPFLNTVGKS
ncbi:glycoside hydrolase family 16 protein [Kitasatospora cathayae]|uniref:Glycoside hydrolase family 16 protein n=1 Tax=Kitasatospora cathayae TaxID=3004092 RepID=A0ABY7Q0H8_9ACTN|nr:glycoside hydrolase family 16 protein [Kitasatospora sp. HUAS 3-15]WBP86126.1 glycoside hydrolase family 16 protein [Kitasatospora sp. HUAS 3-15]